LRWATLIYRITIQQYSRWFSIINIL
jgi:hypothetical protein